MNHSIQVFKAKTEKFTKAEAVNKYKQQGGQITCTHIYDRLAFSLSTVDLDRIDYSFGWQ
jgi:hypothetical protein